MKLLFRRGHLLDAAGVSKPREKWHESKQIEWVIICILVIAFMAVVVPKFIGARSTSSVNSCNNILVLIDSAANQFALEHKLTNGARINFPNDLTPYIKLNSAGKIPGCPQGGVYHISKVGETPTCSLGTTVTPAHVLP